jgi:NAD(P)-dependent dehydrogenase (short-subunit alcohol dehydrogenase family)
VGAITSLADTPDVIVLNAGIAAAGSVEDAPLEVWHKLFSTNLFGPVEFIRGLLPSLRAAGQGRILAVSSLAGLRGMPVSAMYSSSKSAFERWVESLAAEIAPFGLGVTLFVPGMFDTEIITGKSPDYGNYAGPYAPHYAAMRRATASMIDKAASPRIFARSLEKALGDTAPFIRRTVGTDALLMSVAARMLPARSFHTLLCKVLGLPGNRELGRWADH